MFPSKYRGLSGLSAMQILTAVSCRSGGQNFFLLSPLSKPLSRGVDDVEEHPSLSGAREGEVCMKYKDHHTRHPRGHLGDRASAQGARGCAWRDDQFGRGQNTVLGWSDPLLNTVQWPKWCLGSLQHM